MQHLFRCIRTPILAITVVLVGCLPTAPAGQEPGDDDTGLTDGEIAGITNAANEGEVDVAQHVLDKDASAPVNLFATEMVTDHTVALTRQNALFASLGIQPVETATSQELRDLTQQTLDTLEPLDGPAMDIAYAESQVEMHQRILDIINNQLLPDVESNAFRLDLELMKDDIEEHLNDARGLVETLNGTLDAGVDDTEDAGGDDDGTGDDDDSADDRYPPL